MATDTENRAEQQAQRCMDSIRETMEAFHAAEESEGKVDFDGEELDADEIRQRIFEEPLSVEVRSDWHAPGGGGVSSGEYKILLSWGGPAVQITGDLSEHGDPETAKLQFQDWYTPWTDLCISSEDEEILVEYAGMFYFGE